MSVASRLVFSVKNRKSTWRRNFKKRFCQSLTHGPRNCFKIDWNSYSVYFDCRSNGLLKPLCQWDVHVNWSCITHAMDNRNEKCGKCVLEQLTATSMDKESSPRILKQKHKRDFCYLWGFDFRVHIQVRLTRGWEIEHWAVLVSINKSQIFSYGTGSLILFVGLARSFCFVYEFVYDFWLW